MASLILSQARWLTATTVVMESAWLTAASGVMFTLGGAGSPLNWFAVIAVVVVGFFTSRLLHLLIDPNSFARSLRAAAVWSATALVAAYLMVANQLDSELALDLAWILHVAEAAYQPNSEGYLSRAFWGTFLGLVFWWRGAHVAASDQPLITSLTSFRLGLVVVGTSVIVEMASSSRLSAVAVMILFVFSGLASLAIGRMTTGSVRLPRLSAWSIVIAPVILAVVGIGVAFGLLLSILLPSFRQLLATPVSFVGRTVIGPVIMFAAYLWSSFVAWLVGLTASFGQTTGQIAGAERSPSLDDAVAADNSLPLFLEVMFWVMLVVVLVVVVAIVLVLTASALRRVAARSRTEEEGQRESTREGSDVLSDTRSLLYALLPRRSRKSPKERFELPDDAPSVVEALRTYYLLLRVADARSVTRPPSETPSEFQERLQAVFPPRLVELATNAFNLACYGHREPSELHLSELRAQVSLDSGELAKAVREDRSRPLIRV